MKFVGPISTLTKIVVAALGCWYLAVIVLFVFPHLLPTISGLVFLFSLPVVLTLGILALMALIRDNYKLWPALSVALMFFVVYLVFHHTMNWGARVHFFLNKGYYEATVAKALAAQNDEERKQVCGEKCRVTSPPPRVVFHYLMGFLTSVDIAYDPSGSLVRPVTSRERFAISPYFSGAEHLAGDWYLVHNVD